MGNYGMDYNGNSCTNELHYILSKNLMIRRLKSDVLSELPSKRRQKIEVQCDSKIIKKIDKIRAELSEIKTEQDIFNGKQMTFDDYIEGQE